jgi:site-specific recombinase XerD
MEILKNELDEADKPTVSVVTSSPSVTVALPAVITAEGPEASERFFTFFTDNIRNPNTREAYLRNARRFFRWCEDRQLTLKDIRSFHVSAYIEELLLTLDAPSVKQHLATIRMLFDWLILGHIVTINPAQAVRGPKHVVKKGKTPVLSEDEARDLLESIKGEDLVSLRDRALIAVCLYSLARIEAALGMDVEDYYPQGKRWWFRLHEKGGKRHDMPAHHKAEDYVDAYLKAAKLWDKKKEPIFRAALGKTKQLSPERMTRHAALKMIQRRAKKAGILTAICCHSFRATGITNYLEHGGTLEKAQAMAAHESPKTTKLYDRTSDQITLDEVERIAI